jgi:hypothetical protein
VETISTFEKQVMADWALLEKNLRNPATSRAEAWSFFLPLILELKTQGFDKKLRPGSQMSSLIFSRSFAYGLRQDQARITISTVADKFCFEAFFPKGQSQNVYQSDRFYLLR